MIHFIHLYVMHIHLRHRYLLLNLLTEEVQKMTWLLVLSCHFLIRTANVNVS